MSGSHTVVPAGNPGSARLGLTLRSVLLAPHDGFTAALKTAERRARAERRPAEGLSPYVLAFFAGAATFTLWLKVGALAGLREFCGDQYVAINIAGSLVLGGLLALLGQAIWGLVGPRTVRGLRGDTGGGSLRLVWGASGFPQVLALAVLLPLDLLIVGTDTYATGSLPDPLSTAWAAFSIALGISALVWSFFLFIRGVEVAAGLSFWRAAAAAGVALFCLVAVAALVVVIATSTSEVRSCPTRLG